MPFISHNSSLPSIYSMHHNYLDQGKYLKGYSQIIKKYLFQRYQLESIICARTWGRLFVTQACLTSGNLGQLWITLPVHDHHKQWRGSITWLFLICPKLFPTINPPPGAHYCTGDKNFERNCWNTWEVVHILYQWSCEGGSKKDNRGQGEGHG